MNPSQRLHQPSLSRLGRTGLLFLGSIALSHGFVAAAPQSSGASPSTGSNPPTRRAGDNFRQGATTHDDSRFITETENMLRRIQALSRVAAENSAGELREFARSLERQQAELGAELTALAGERKIKLASTAAGDRPTQPRLDPRAPRFQENYLRQMIEDHERALQWFEGAARHSTDVEISAFGQKYTALLRRNFDRAQAAMQGLNKR